MGTCCPESTTRGATFSREMHFKNCPYSNSNSIIVHTQSFGSHVTALDPALSTGIIFP